MGQVYTPKEVTKFISKWAIRDEDACVLEPSVGEGAFVFEAYERLQETGASKEKALDNIIGFEKDPETFERFETLSKENIGQSFPNIKQGDLFNQDLPEADVVIGNPPYVIRHLFNNPEKIFNQDSAYEFSDQADMYIYFIVKAIKSLKTGGRFGMIVSNSWMKKKYGEEFKQFLLDNLDLTAVIGFEEKVFDERDINSVLLLGRKKERTIQRQDLGETYFIQVKNPSTFENIDGNSTWEDLGKKGLRYDSIPQKDLASGDYWDIWLRAPKFFRKIKEDDLFVNLNSFARPMIGVQTLHKDFYVIEGNSDIEDEFLHPIAYTPRDHQEPTLKRSDCKYNLFWCDKPIEKLKETNAFNYIIEAEQETIEKRYSDEVYQGVHNKKRIKQTNRSPWYNLKDEAERRLPAHILLPRRVYESYTAVWNKDKVVPSENFLATTVEKDKHIKPLLAYLNSTVGELCLRLSGQVYGGGVCDLNVSSSKKISCLNLEKIGEDDLETLTEAFNQFAQSRDRSILDREVYNLLNFSKEEREEVKEALRLVIRESVDK